MIYFSKNVSSGTYETVWKNDSFIEVAGSFCYNANSSHYFSSGRDINYNKWYFNKEKILDIV